MYIIDAHIYGFGKWTNTTFTFEPSFTSFYGENESGKSTLQQFILFILYGLPPKDQKKYLPKTSHHFGGYLTVQFEGKVITVERTAERFRLWTEESELPSTYHQTILQQMTRKTYESVYSFTAEQLFEIQRISQEEINELLFSIGLTGSTSIYTIEKDIQKKLQQLFKQRGWKAKINEQLHKLEQLAKEIEKLEQEVATYSHKKNVLEQDKNEIAKLKQSIDEKQENIQLYEKILRVYDSYMSYKNLIKIKKELEKEIPFPQKGIERYERLKERLQILASEKESYEMEINKINEAINQLQDKLLDEEVAYLLRELLHDKLTFIEYEKDIAFTEEKIKKINNNINEIVNTAPISMDDIEEIILPFDIDETVEQLINDKQTLLKEQQELEKNYTEVDNNLQYIEKEINDIKKRIYSDEKLEALRNTNRLYEQTNNQKRRTYDTYYMIAYGMLFLIIILFSFIQDAKINLLFAVFLVLLGINQFVRLRKREGTIDLIPISIEEYQENTQKLDEQVYLKQEKLHLQSEHKRIMYDKLMVQNKLEQFQLKEEKWKDKQDTILYQYPFLKEVNLQSWKQFIEIIRQLKQLLADRKEQMNILQTLQETYEPLLQLKMKVAESIHYPNVSLAELEKIYDNDKNNQRELQQLFITREEKDLYIHKKNNENNLVEKEISQLFSQAKVETEDQYYYIHDQKNENLQKLHKLRELEEMLHNQFTKQEQEKIANMQLNESTLREQLQRLYEDKKQESEILNNKTEKMYKLLYEMEQMETSDQLSQKKYQYELEKETLRRHVEKYTIYKMTQEAMQAAKLKYQATYFEAVMEKTSYYFNKLTKGEYWKVHPPKETSHFQVESKHKQYFSLLELSKGTIDQLYIALRLAMNIVMRDKVNVPLLIDDAFVHFDTKREKQMIQLLKEISVDQQVIIFTCQRPLAIQLEARNMSTIAGDRR